MRGWIAVPLLVAVACVAACSRQEMSTPAVERRPCLLVIGVDGAEWDLIDPLIERGAVPNLAALVAGGTAVRTRSPQPLLSPALWTTIGTGRLSHEHGVTWFMSRNDSGQLLPVSSADREVPAVWDVAGSDGRTVAVVGWWATWPVEAVNGVMVSDRLVSHGFGLGSERPQAELVFPAARTSEMLALAAGAEGVVPPEFAGLLQPGNPAGAAPGGQVSSDDLLRAAVLQVEAYHRITKRLLEEGSFDLVCAYFEGLDTVSHVFMPLAPPAMPGVDPELARRYGSVVERFYRYQDRLIGELVAAAGDGRTVIVVSDHGFRSGSKRRSQPALEFSMREAARDHLVEGVLILNGPPFPAGVRSSGIALEKVASLILQTLGLPLEAVAARELPRQLFTPAFLAAKPPREVAAYAARTPPTLPVEATVGSDVEQRRLEALGYVQPSVAGDPHGHALELELAEIGSLVNAGRLDEACSRFQDLAERHPDNPRPVLELVRVALDQGRVVAARSQLERARERGATPAEIGELEGRLLMAEGRLDEADRSLREALAGDPGSVATLRALADVYYRGRRFEEARREIISLIELEPGSAQVWTNLGRVEEALADPAAAAAAYQRALATEPANLFALNALGMIYERQRDFPTAEAFYRRALTAAPGDLTASLQLGFLLLNLKRPDEALEPLHEAARQRPDIAALQQALHKAEAEVGQRRP